MKTDMYRIGVEAFNSETDFSKLLDISEKMFYCNLGELTFQLQTSSTLAERNS